MRVSGLWARSERTSFPRMSAPQDPGARKREKAKRRKKLAEWRAKKEAEAAKAGEPSKAKSGA